MKHQVFIALSVILLSACATAPDPVTHDGLQRVDKTRFDELYLKPDVVLSDYTAIRLEPCTVAFRSGWLRSQNSAGRDSNYRVTEADVTAIKERISESCDRHFNQALADNPHYQLLSEGDDSAQVLVLSPSIIDLDIRAPDMSAAGIRRTYTTSFGEMTLFMEMHDSASGEILGRVVDRQRDSEKTYLQWTNRATNMADVNRFLRSWTASLVSGLDAAHAHAAAENN